MKELHKLHNFKTDIFGNEPEVGDTIVFNPPKYKGLISGTCLGFTATGAPKVNLDVESNKLHYTAFANYITNGYYVPKTEFVVIIQKTKY